MPEQITNQTITGDVLFHWEIQEYESYDRTARWFVIMGILGFLMVSYALITNNFMFALVIVLVAVVLYLQHNQEPLKIPFSITEMGIIVGSRLYKWEELQSFYIVYEPTQTTSLYFETKSSLRPTIQIPLESQNPVDIRDVLLSFLSENSDQEKEPLSDRFARNWRIH